MIEQISARLTQWVSGVLPGAEVSLLPPGGQPDGRGVSLYLMELADKHPTLNGVRRLQLRYLVTTWAEQPSDAHQLLGELVLAAMEEADFEVVCQPLSPEAWTALGAQPRPSFLLCAPMQRQSKALDTPLVRGPLVIQATPLTSLHGVVVGPGGIPLAGARVELPGLQLHKSTDAKGRFSFSAVPGYPLMGQLVVKARGRELQLSVEQSTSRSEPLLIQFDIHDGKEE